MPELISAVPKINWPSIPQPHAAQLFAILQQFETSQWLPPKQLQALQFRQLHTLLSHAQLLPFYRERLKKARFSPYEALTPEVWRQIPLLTRAEIQAQGDKLQSASLPAEHGDKFTIETSGSTGMPIKVTGSAVTRLFWEANTLREHLWQRRDFGGKLAVIRYMDNNHQSPQGYSQQSWGMPADALYRTGPSVALSITLSLEQQAQWLISQAPAYLLTHPSTVLALADYFMANSLSLPSLKEVRTFAETLPDELRAACHRAWNAKVTDMYSSKDAGYMALQCPESGDYHVMAESVYLEILNDSNEPCAPGEIGRVIVTPLHNFATPLLRYDIGDYAEAGAVCGCGRGLPVLKRILGRVRNLITLPNGHKSWPIFPKFESAAPVLQRQIIQRAPDHLDIYLVVARPLTPAEENTLTKLSHDRFGFLFTISYHYVDHIPRSAQGKFEEFKSEIAA